MIFAYLTATESNTQRNQIQQYADAQGWKITRWIEEDATDEGQNTFTQLHALTLLIQPNDVILTTQITNLGPSMQAFLEFLHEHFQHQGNIQTIQEGYNLCYDGVKNCFADTLDLLSEIAHHFSTRRTLNAVESGRRRGTQLGRPMGIHTSPAKETLLARSEEIRALLATGISTLELSKRLNASYATLYRFLQSHPELAK